MAKVSTNVSIDEDVKKKAQVLFADLGLDLSTAVNIFLRQSIRQSAIPFHISQDIPNSDTIAAIEEVKEMERNPGSYKKYATFSELLQEVERDV